MILDRVAWALAAFTVLPWLGVAACRALQGRWIETGVAASLAAANVFLSLL